MFLSDHSSIYHKRTPYQALYNLLASPTCTTAFRSSEGNVESSFSKILLLSFANIPLTWFDHQKTINNKRPDILITLNNRYVLVIECKREGILSKLKGYKEAREQVFSYAEILNCNYAMITDGNHLTFFDNKQVILKCNSKKEILKYYQELAYLLNPMRLYKISRNLLFLDDNPKITPLFRSIKKGEINNFAQISNHISHNTISEQHIHLLKNEIESWKSLWAHLKESDQLKRGKKFEDQIIHVDYSYVSYFDHCWYYDDLHLCVRHNEEVFTSRCPGFAIRIFVYNDIKEFSNNSDRFMEFIEALLYSGYRVAFISRKNWLTSGIHDGHIDIIANKYAKIYTHSNILLGDIMLDQNKIKSLRDFILNIIHETGFIFKPIAIDQFSFNKFVEWLCNPDNLT